MRDAEEAGSEDEGKMLPEDDDDDKELPEGGWMDETRAEADEAE